MNGKSMRGGETWEVQRRGSQCPLEPWDSSDPADFMESRSKVAYRGGQAQRIQSCPCLCIGSRTSLL